MNLDVLADASERISYDDPATPIYVRHGNLRGFSGMAALCHWHSEVELLMPERGYLSYMVGGGRVEIAEGEVIFVNSRRMHYGFSTDGTDCEYLCVVFDPRIICGSAEIERRFVEPVVSDTDCAYMLLGGAELAALLSELDGVWSEKAPGFELSAAGVLFRIWRTLYREAGKRSGELAPTDENARTVRKMLEFIRKNYARRISAEDIASAGGVCRTQCFKLFRKYLGKTPNEYLNSLRLEKAAALLKETNTPVTEAAAVCGFSSGSYFTELFSREKGCTPTSYRAKFARFSENALDKTINRSYNI